MPFLPLLDVAPDPVNTGIFVAVILLVIGIVVFLLGALVLFLWFRKRSMRHVEMIRPDAQPSNPNQP